MNNILLAVNKVNKSYGEKKVLRDINFEVEYGKIIGLLGKNGAGKTTLIKIILGLTQNYEGDIIYQGASLNREDVNIMNTIGSLVDTTFHYDLSAYDNLKMLMMVTPGIQEEEIDNKIYELLEFVDLEKNAKKQVKTFSFGMKQRLALAQALISDPKMLILDEPFVGLDPIGIEALKEKLRYLCSEKKVSIIFSSHQLPEVKELSDEIVAIDNGVVKYNGSYKNLENGNKKYKIYIDKKKDRDKCINIPTIYEDNISIDDNLITVSYKSNYLNDVIEEISSKKVKIDKIEIEDNSLINLFR